MPIETSRLTYISDAEHEALEYWSRGWGTNLYVLREVGSTGVPSIGTQTPENGIQPILTFEDDYTSNGQSAADTLALIIANAGDIKRALGERDVLARERDELRTENLRLTNAAQLSCPSIMQQKEPVG
jgi:hypothetical protein